MVMLRQTTQSRLAFGGRRATANDNQDGFRCGSRQGGKYLACSSIIRPYCVLVVRHDEVLNDDSLRLQVGKLR